MVLARLQVPWPFLIKPVPVVVERFCAAKSKVFPPATLTEATVPVGSPVPRIMLFEASVTFSLATMDLKLEVAVGPVMVRRVPPFASKTTSEFSTQAEA